MLCPAADEDPSLLAGLRHSKHFLKQANSFDLINLVEAINDNVDAAGTGQKLNQYVGGGSEIRAESLATDFTNNILERTIVSSKLKDQRMKDRERRRLMFKSVTEEREDHPTAQGSVGASLINNTDCEERLACMWITD
jgi:hypothetical protein